MEKPAKNDARELSLNEYDKKEAGYMYLLNAEFPWKPVGLPEGP